MKRLIIAILLFSTVSTASFAQKYLTRTGKVSFFSTTPIENIEAFNNETASILDGKSGDIVFQVPVKSFKFEKETMQEHFNDDYMESSKFSKSEFKGRIADISKVNFSKDGTYNVVAKGKLSMHGVTRDVSVPGTIVIKGSEATLNAKFDVMPSDYNIKIPSIVASKIAKNIQITVNSILTAVQK
jgi:polyisoprenoid-binding protein YceI